jgi:hypothetical protein
MLSRFLTLVLAISLIAGTTAPAREQQEDSRITALIAAVESLQDAKFVRNGSEHDAKAAADHLRLKLGKAGERVKTAEEFIEGCASKSSFTGEKYLIRYADGKEVEAGTFLQDKLKEIDQTVAK